MSSKQTEKKGEIPSKGGEYAVKTPNADTWYKGKEKQLQIEAIGVNGVTSQDIPDGFLTECELALDAYIYDRETDVYYRDLNEDDHEELI